MAKLDPSIVEPCMKAVEEIVEKNKPIRTFSTGATRDSAANKLDYARFLSPLVLRRFAQFMLKHRTQPDGSLREPDNWKKGIPMQAYMDSLFRHVVEVWLIHEGYRAVDEKGETVDLEEALCAILFNASGYLHGMLDEIIKVNRGGKT